MEDSLQHLRDKFFSNILFIHRKFFICKIQENNDLVDHINKIKAIVDQLVYLKILTWEENIIMTLLESLPMSYEFLIIALDTMSMKELMMGYMTICLMHKIWMCK